MNSKTFHEGNCIMNTQVIKPARLESEEGRWAGSTEEFMNIGGPFDSKDEAIEAGKADRPGESFYICRAKVGAWTAPNAEAILEDWFENNHDLAYDGDEMGFTGSPQKQLDIQNDLQTSLNEWFLQIKDSLTTPTAFESTMDIELIKGDENPAN